MKRFLPVVLFAICTFCFMRPSLLAGAYHYDIQFLTRETSAFLALGLLLFRFPDLIAIGKALTLSEKIFFGVSFLFAVYFECVSGLRIGPGGNLIYLLIPLFAAVYRKEIYRILPAFLTLFFIWNLLVISGMLVFHREHIPYGLAANWNWSAVLLLLTFPFAMILISEKAALLNKKLRSFLIFLPLMLTLLTLTIMRSRAAWLLILLYAVLSVLLRFKKYSFKLIAGLVLCAALSGSCFLYFFSGKAASFLSQEIRMNLFECGLCVIQEKPLGTGAAAYENLFSGFRDTSYFLNQHAAVRSPHPHNELLYLLGAFGIPAGLSLILLWISGIIRFLKKKESGPLLTVNNAVFCGWIIGLAYSLLDLPFHAWPLYGILLIFGGLITFPEITPVEKKNRISQFAAWFVVLCCIADILLTGFATVSAELSKHAYKKNHPQKGLSYTMAALPFLQKNPEILYSRIIDAYQARQVAPALEMTARLQATPNRDFSRIHALKANLLAMAGRDPEAIEEYKLELRRYPHLILPVIGLINASGRLNRTEDVAKYKLLLAEQIKRRKLTREQFQRILKYPMYDIRMNDRSPYIGLFLRAEREAQADSAKVQ